MKEQYRQFEATLENLEPISLFIQQFMQNYGLDDEQVYNFEIAADEHVSNLVEHAFEDSTGKSICITCRNDNEQFQVIITDDSAGFDPRNYSVPDVEEQPIYELPPGGFGNYFICELIDHVEYIHNPYVKNQLILTIRQSPEQAQSVIPGK